MFENVNVVASGSIVFQVPSQAHSKLTIARCSITPNVVRIAYTNGNSTECRDRSHKIARALETIASKTWLESGRFRRGTAERGVCASDSQSSSQVIFRGQ